MCHSRPHIISQHTCRSPVLLLHPPGITHPRESLTAPSQLTQHFPPPEIQWDSAGIKQPPPFTIITFAQNFIAEVRGQQVEGVNFQQYLILKPHQEQNNEGGFVTFQTSPESSLETFLVCVAHSQPAWKH